MRYMLLLAIFGAVFGLFAEPVVAHAAGCDAGRFHAADGSITAACYVVTADVRGHACSPVAFIDGGGIGTATARQMAERTARIACAEEYSVNVLGERHMGSFSPDGGDAFSVRPGEVRVLSVERR